MYKNDEFEDDEEYQAMLLNNPNDSVVLIGTYNLSFLYNEYGDLYRINTTSTDSPIYTELTLSQQKRIEKVKAVEGADTKVETVMTYTNNFLQQIDSREIDSATELILHYEYNNKQLPSIIKGEEKKDNEYVNRLEVLLEYNTTDELTSIKSKGHKFNLSYDKARNPHAGLSYFYTHEIQPILGILHYTNYIQKHNITRIEDSDEITTITYTYNQDNLPTKALVKTKLKRYDSYSDSFLQYEYFYKEIEIVE
ncbi:hypothetical protein HX023_05970 [Myroides marinus]|nr:hypothetical protein [Myroides marinus]MDM1375046.1 hypothetical protein [Myroides marinus]